MSRRKVALTSVNIWKLYHWEEKGSQDKGELISLRPKKIETTTTYILNYFKVFNTTKEQKPPQIEFETIRVVFYDVTDHENIYKSNRIFLFCL